MCGVRSTFSTPHESTTAWMCPAAAALLHHSHHTPQLCSLRSITGSLPALLPPIPIPAMLEEARSALSRGDEKHQSTSHSQPSTAIPHQLPAALLNLVYLCLPWYERLLHVTHLRRQLLPGPFVWSEHDHVRLSWALLDAVDALQPSAVHCLRYMQSLCVEAAMDEELLTIIDDEFDVDQPAALTRLESCLQQLQLRTRSQPATPPFSHLRCLIASHSVFQCLLECSELSHLHSLSLYSPSPDADPEQDDDSDLLSMYLITRPVLRRLRIERMRVAYVDLSNLPTIEYVDLRRAYTIIPEEPVGAPMSASLRSLLLDQRVQIADVFASLAPTSLQHLSLRARLTDADLHTLTALQSLTGLEFNGCEFDNTNALSLLMSDEGEPLLPSLQRFSIEDCDAEEIDYEDMRTSTAAFLYAYSHQLRHIKLDVKTDPVNSLQAVLSAIVSSMPQLESLMLAVQFDIDSSEVVEEIGLPSEADTLHRQPPALRSLRSLALHNLPMNDAAVEQLLTCCPQLLELTIDRVSVVTAAVWSSLLHCRQLLALSFRSSTVEVSEAGFTRAMLSSSSSAARPSTAAFPFLTHLNLAFGDSEHVDPAGFEQLLNLFDGSPITTLALQLPHDVEHGQYALQLASLPHLTSLQLELGADSDDGDPQPMEDSIARLLEECSDEMRWSSEQHHVDMRYYWQDGLLGEDEDELRARYAAGVKVPAPTWPPGRGSGYRVFKRAQSEQEEDGRARFFRVLETLEEDAGEQ